MFDGLLLTIAIVVGPLIMSIILQRFNKSRPDEPTDSVNASYWGNYSGTRKHRMQPRIKLQKTSADKDGSGNVTSTVIHPTTTWHA